MRHSRLIWTVAALMALLALTVASAFVPMGKMNIVANVGIAAVKAGLVAWVFMHVATESTTVRAIAVVIVLWVALLYSLTFVDRATRPEQPDLLSPPGATEGAGPTTGQSPTRSTDFSIDSLRGSKPGLNPNGLKTAR